MYAVRSDSGAEASAALSVRVAERTPLALSVRVAASAQADTAAARAEAAGEPCFLS